MGLTEALLHPYFPRGPGWEGLGCGQQGQAQWRGHRAYNSSCCSELLSLPPETTLGRGPVAAAATLMGCSWVTCYLHSAPA